MTAIDASARAYLHAYLAPLAPLLARDDVTDIYINRPREIWAETLGGAIERHAAPGLEADVLARLARQIAAQSDQGISREHPLLSGRLPDGSRVQIVMPPATRGDLALAIRKHLSSDLTLDDYVASGAFADTRHGRTTGPSAIDATLADHLARGDIAALLSAAVKARRNILVSGGTSTGKTTFLNALLREVPADERLILIEDTPELRIGQPNAVGLVATRGHQGEARVTANDLLAAALRMRPDRIILGELRGDEAFTFLRAVNTGHPGSITTVHADSAASAVEQLVLLTLQAGTPLRRDDVKHYVENTIDVFVQLSRIGGKRIVHEIVLRQP